MLTVKIVYPNYHEQIFEATKVSYLPKDPNGVAEEQVLFFGESGFDQSLRDGMIYVMNREGSTIAKYDLMPPPPVEKMSAPKQIIKAAA